MHLIEPLAFWTLEPLPLPDMLKVAREAGYSAVELRWDDIASRGAVATLIGRLS